ncbi:uncharacterized protein LOC135123465 isoform X2 [Zophobas morio]|uniref:uncharacterized protein LOC135123465 isoform X2 n=1 Tax=Zophobas morio TaxID=2755281 RepID=UPI00308365E2
MGSNTHILEVGEDVLGLVVKLLNYSSIDSFNEDVRKIKEWIKKQPHFPEMMADKKIQNFLILNKGSVERSKEKIENYYNVRSRLPEIFDNIHPKLPYMEKVKESVFFVPLPKLTKEHYRVCIYKMRDIHSAENVEMVHFIHLVFNIQEIRMIEDVTYGDVFIFDGKHSTLRFMLKATPVMIYKALIVIYKQVFSNRLKAVYLINAPYYVEKFVDFLKSALKPKLITRIHFCENSDDLVEKIGKEILPEDYGGEEKSLKELQADKKIQNFLILNKGSVERSKEKIENYYNVRSRLPEIFDNIHPKLPYMEKVKESVFFVPLPKLTQEHYRVFIYKMRDIHLAENVEMVHFIHLLFNIQEIRMIEDVTYGDVFIFDGKHSTLRFMLKATPVMIYKALIVIYKQVFSNRLKAVYLINAPSFTEKLLAILKSILKPKLMERIHFCENSDDLIEKIGKEILSEDYGGEEMSLKELQNESTEEKKRVYYK